MIIIVFVSPSSATLNTTTDKISITSASASGLACNGDKDKKMIISPRMT